MVDAGHLAREVREPALAMSRAATVSPMRVPEGGEGGREGGRVRKNYTSTEKGGREGGREGGFSYLDWAPPWPSSPTNKHATASGTRPTSPSAW